MDEEKIIALLRCPSAPLVELALAMANLTWKEELAITLHKIMIHESIVLSMVSRFSPIFCTPEFTPRGFLLPLSGAKALSTAPAVNWGWRSVRWV